MAYDPATYKVNLDTPQPDGRKGESPRNAFTKYNALVDALKNAPPAPSSTTTNKIPQWSNTTGGLKDGLGLSTSGTLSGNSDSNVPSEKAVKAYVDSQPKPQDFGIGRMDNGVRLSTSELENPLPNGVYTIDSSNESPEKPSNFGVMWAGSYTGDNDRKCQIWMGLTTSKLFIRSTRHSFEWAEVLTTLNTNLIVSSGSNANGNWVQFADGTQICWNRFENLASPGANNILTTSWTYPKAFTSPSANSVSVRTPTPTSYAGISTGGNRTTELTIYTQRPTTDPHYFEATATGFWK